MKNLIWGFIFAITAFGGEGTIILSKRNAQEWCVKYDGLSANKISSKCLVIGNDGFQIRQSLASVKRILVKRKIRPLDNKMFMEILFSVGTNEGVFLLPADIRYFMYDDLVVHSGKKNIWISNITPNIDVGVTYFGNLSNNHEKSAEHNISICVWVENTSPLPTMGFYQQQELDIIKISKPPVGYAKNAKEFIEYNGVLYLSPFLTMRELSICGTKSCDCDLELSLLQNKLCYNILRFDNGKIDLLEVLECCQKLFSFYLLHSSNIELKNVLNNRLIYIKSMILRQKQFYFETGTESY